MKEKITPIEIKLRHLLESNQGFGPKGLCIKDVTVAYNGAANKTVGQGHDYNGINCYFEGFRVDFSTLETTTQYRPDLVHVALELLIPQKDDTLPAVSPEESLATVNELIEKLPQAPMHYAKIRGIIRVFKARIKKIQGTNAPLDEYLRSAAEQGFTIPVLDKSGQVISLLIYNQKRPDNDLTGG